MYESKKRFKKSIFLYKGEIIDLKLKYINILKDINKNTKKIKILVEECNKEERKEIKIFSKEIICSKCKEIVLIKMHDYKIDLNECKNGHKFNNIFFNEFENSQMVDIAKIICDDCKILNKSNTYNNEMSKCLS